MPTYELCLMIRTMPKTELANALKRVATTIYDKNGLIRKIENLGHRELPYKTSMHGLSHKEAHYFMFTLDTKSADVKFLSHEYKRDIDIIRRRFYKVEPVEDKPCTLHDDLLPPMYRPSVQKMLKHKKDKRNPFTHDFHYNSGLDYYPFQK